MKKTALNMALSTALIVSFGMGISACSGDKESKVYAPDRVDEAAELARSNAPEAEVMDFPEVEVVATDAEADTSMATEEDAMADETLESDADTADTDVADTETPAADDVAADDEVEPEPAAS